MSRSLSANTQTNLLPTMFLRSSCAAGMGMPSHLTASTCHRESPCARGARRQDDDASKDEEEDDDDDDDDAEDGAGRVEKSR